MCFSGPPGVTIPDSPAPAPLPTPEELAKKRVREQALRRGRESVVVDPAIGTGGSATNTTGINIPLS